MSAVSASASPAPDGDPASGEPASASDGGGGPAPATDAFGYPAEVNEIWARPLPAAAQAEPATPTPAQPATVVPPFAPREPSPPSARPAPDTAATPALTFRHHLLVLGFALLGGPLGIVGAITQELQAGALGFLAAGVIEEALKPSGIYIVLAKWPYALRGRIYTATFAALSGLLFGIIEASTYVFVYFPDKGGDFVLYRFTVPLLLHTGCSFIYGLGIRPELVDWVNGVAKFPRASRNFFIAAMTIHASFNLIVVILAAAGVLSFD